MGILKLLAPIFVRILSMIIDKYVEEKEIKRQWKLLVARLYKKGLAPKRLRDDYLEALEKF